MGPPAPQGEFAGTGRANQGDFSCWRDHRKNVYNWVEYLCTGIYDRNRKYLFNPSSRQRRHGHLQAEPPPPPSPPSTPTSTNNAAATTVTTDATTVTKTATSSSATDTSRGLRGVGQGEQTPPSSSAGTKTQSGTLMPTAGRPAFA